VTLIQRLAGSCALALVLLAVPAAGPGAEDPAPAGGSTVLDFTLRRLDGREQALSDYEGKVLLLVNVASRCGLTPQYAGLESLYERYRARGFEVLGFPANDFAAQEPGSDSEIAEFCRLNYGVSFPMFSKITVKGPGQHPLYRSLTGLPAPLGGDVEWNFQKYLVDRSGRVVSKFSPRVVPEDPALVAEIESLLGSD
jgi:glutathione peroxidase